MSECYLGYIMNYSLLSIGRMQYCYLWLHAKRIGRSMKTSDFASRELCFVLIQTLIEA
jgi:hypothetical protein